MFLNVSLSAYFMLMIVFGYRERRLKRKRLWLFGAPLIVGFTLSFAVLPFVGMAYTHCQFDLTIPWVLFVFGLIPILGSSFSILAMLFIIYHHVRRQARRQRRCDFEAEGSNTISLGRELVQASSQTNRLYSRKKAAHKSKLEQMVFRQCLAYAAAFGITWPIFGLAWAKGRYNDLPYGFWVFVMATSALQGFNNALCYFRPRKSPRVAFRCRGFRNKSGICDCFHRGARRRGEGTASQPSLNMQYLSTVDPRSLEEMSSTSSTHRHHLDPAVELANLSDQDEDEVLDANVREGSKTENVSVECSVQGGHISKFDVVSGAGFADQQTLGLFQSAVEDIAQYEVDQKDVRESSSIREFRSCRLSTVPEDD